MRNNRPSFAGADLMARVVRVLLPFPLLVTALAGPGRANPTCDTLHHSSAPFQIHQTVVMDAPGKPEQTSPAVTEVHRADGGAFLAIMSGPMGLIRNTGRYGTILTSHTKTLSLKETRFEHRPEPSGAAGFGEKRDFSYKGTLSTDGGKTFKTAFTRAKFLGERDVSVGNCTFHVLDYRVTREIEQNGLVAPKFEYDVAYAPDLLYHLHVVTTAVASGYRVETRTTDLVTRFKPLPDPGN